MSGVRQILSDMAARDLWEPILPFGLEDERQRIRIENALRRAAAEFETAEDVAAFRGAETLPNMGRKSLDMVAVALEERGLDSGKWRVPVPVYRGDGKGGDAVRSLYDLTWEAVFNHPVEVKKAPV